MNISVWEAAARVSAWQKVRDSSTRPTCVTGCDQKYPTRTVVSEGGVEEEGSPLEDGHERNGHRRRICPAGGQGGHIVPFHAGAIRIAPRHLQTEVICRELGVPGDEDAPGDLGDSQKSPWKSDNRRIET